MVGPLVGTKFHMPRLRRGAVVRPRLADRLRLGTQAKLTLISAPAGFGKTTSLVSWLADDLRAQRRVAWLSLEDNDSQPAVFWMYVVSALQTAVPGVGDGILPLLQSANPPITTVLSTVLNELAAVPDNVVLVLDDYHLADGPEVAVGMTFLLEHLPANVLVVISTRADPDLPLARLRANGDLVEVRAADLRFSGEETTDYLQAAGLHLSEQEIAVLAERTEGWVAALQLAALSMQGRDDTAGFIAGFAGDDRYIVDYLVDEVLARQPDAVRSYLLRTSILDRLSGPLCDAVTGVSGGRAMLEALDRGNLFVVPLDNNRQWYRYHHLFADVLATHLRDEAPEELPELHRRASRWYERAGEPGAAVRHAVACGDVDRAADLVELAVPALLRDRQEATLRGWLDFIPDELVRARPILAVGSIGSQMAGNDFDGVPARLRDVERSLEQLAASDGAATPVARAAELARLPAVVQMYWAALALVGGDTAGTHEHAQRALELATQGDDVTRASARALSGLASWSVGDLDSAFRDYGLCVEGLQGAGHVSDVLGCSIALADIRLTQGRLRDARQVYEDALRLAGTRPGVVRGLADMYTGLSQIALEQGDLERAIRWLQRNRELGEAHGLPQNPYRWRVARALVHQERGDLAGAIQFLDEAEAVYLGDFSPNVRPVAALRARLLVARGNLDDAWGWVQDRNLRAGEELSYLREYEHITLAAVLLARYTAERSQEHLREGTGLLERLLASAELGQRGGSVIDILVLLAQARDARGETADALAALERALALAEPEGYVRIFTSAGPPVTALLRLLAARRPTWSYLRHLADAPGPGELDRHPAQPSRVPQAQPVIDRLSERELEVLGLLGTDLDGPDIARHLVVSLNTLRTHTKNIYAKLGVNSRREAVHRAAELNLLPGPRNG